MKKLLSILLVFGMLFAFAGCSDDDDYSKNDNDEAVVCDICDEEIDGEPNELELGDKNAKICDDCYEKIDGGFSDEIDTYGDDIDFSSDPSDYITDKSDEVNDDGDYIYSGGYIFDQNGVVVGTY